jgi:hypothetical protein
MDAELGPETAQNSAKEDEPKADAMETTSKSGAC